MTTTTLSIDDIKLIRNLVRSRLKLRKFYVKTLDGRPTNEPKVTRSVWLAKAIEIPELTKLAAKLDDIIKGARKAK